MWDSGSTAADVDVGYEISHGTGGSVGGGADVPTSSSSSCLLTESERSRQIVYKFEHRKTDLRLELERRRLKAEQRLEFELLTKEKMRRRDSELRAELRKESSKIALEKAKERSHQEYEAMLVRLAEEATAAADCHYESPPPFSASSSTSPRNTSRDGNSNKKAAETMITSDSVSSKNEQQFSKVIDPLSADASPLIGNKHLLHHERPVLSSLRAVTKFNTTETSLQKSTDFGSIKPNLELAGLENSHPNTTAGSMVNDTDSQLSDSLQQDALDRKSLLESEATASLLDLPLNPSHATIPPAIQYKAATALVKAISPLSLHHQQHSTLHSPSHSPSQSQSKTLESKIVESESKKSNRNESVESNSSNNDNNDNNDSSSASSTADLKEGNKNTTIEPSTFSGEAGKSHSILKDSPAATSSPRSQLNQQHLGPMSMKKSTVAEICSGEQLLSLIDTSHDRSPDLVAQAAAMKGPMSTKPHSKLVSSVHSAKGVRFRDRIASIIETVAAAETASLMAATATSSKRNNSTHHPGFAKYAASSSSSSHPNATSNTFAHASGNNNTSHLHHSSSVQPAGAQHLREALTTSFGTTGAPLGGHLKLLGANVETTVLVEQLVLPPPSSLHMKLLRENASHSSDMDPISHGGKRRQKNRENWREPMRVTSTKQHSESGRNNARKPASGSNADDLDTKQHISANASKNEKVTFAEHMQKFRTPPSSPPAVKFPNLEPSHRSLHGVIEEVVHSYYLVDYRQRDGGLRRGIFAGPGTGPFRDGHAAAPWDASAGRASRRRDSKNNASVRHNHLENGKKARAGRRSQQGSPKGFENGNSEQNKSPRNNKKRSSNTGTGIDVHKKDGSDDITVASSSCGEFSGASKTSAVVQLEVTTSSAALESSSLSADNNNHQHDTVIEAKGNTEKLEKTLLQQQHSDHADVEVADAANAPIVLGNAEVINEKRKLVISRERTNSHQRKRDVTTTQDQDHEAGKDPSLQSDLESNGVNFGRDHQKLDDHLYKAPLHLLESLDHGDFNQGWGQGNSTILDKDNHNLLDKANGDHYYKSSAAFHHHNQLLQDNLKVSWSDAKSQHSTAASDDQGSESEGTQSDEGSNYGESNHHRGYHRSQFNNHHHHSSSQYTTPSESLQYYQEGQYSPSRSYLPSVHSSPSPTLKGAMHAATSPMLPRPPAYEQHLRWQEGHDAANHSHSQGHGHAYPPHRAVPPLESHPQHHLASMSNAASGTSSSSAAAVRTLAPVYASKITTSGSIAGTQSSSASWRAPHGGLTEAIKIGSASQPLLKLQGTGFHTAVSSSQTARSGTASTTTPTPASAASMSALPPSRSATTASSRPIEDGPLSVQEQYQFQQQQQQQQLIQQHSPETSLPSNFVLQSSSITAALLSSSSSS